jgi:hypothetical protein
VLSQRVGSDELDARGLAFLRLQPALEAGVAGRARLAGLQDTLLEAFDAVSKACRSVTPGGRRSHSNAALVRSSYPRA